MLIWTYVVRELYEGLYRALRISNVCSACGGILYTYTLYKFPVDFTVNTGNWLQAPLPYIFTVWRSGGGGVEGAGGGGGGGGGEGRFVLGFNDTTRQSLWVILCRLPEKGRKEIEEIVEEMKERNREERGTGMKEKKQKK